MSETCFFCQSLAGEQPGGLVPLDGLDLGPHFAAVWDGHPMTPGHALVIPTRHVQLMNELNDDEQRGLVAAAIAVKAYIRSANLREVYERQNVQPGDRAYEYIAKALAVLDQVGDRPPDAFNDGLNDGPAAGQTIPHFHWHVMPRWQGDVGDARGGIRHMFGDLANWKKV